MKTYIFLGHDNNGAFDQLLASAEVNPNVEIIRPEPGQSMQEAAAHVTDTPARVVLAAHGLPDGTFEWDAGGLVSYGALFGALPQEGIEAISVTSCYGGMAQDHAHTLPPGTILQSLVGKEVVGFNHSIGEFAADIFSPEKSTRVAVLLESLDNVDPQLFPQWAAEINAREGENVIQMDASKVLPHIISIGGNPPIQLDMEGELASLSERARNGTLDAAVFDASVAMVQQYFDGDAGVDTGAVGNVNVDMAVDAVADKLRAGVDPATFSLEEKRMAYAITIAHMENSGALNTMVEQAIQSAVAHTDPAHNIEKDGRLTNGFEDGLIAQGVPDAKGELRKSAEQPAVLVPVEEPVPDESG